MTVKKKIGNRPPFTVYIIEELIKAGKYLEAQNACDASELFFADKKVQMQDLFMDAEKAKRGYMRS
jgi:hypothetical protein